LTGGLLDRTGDFEGVRSQEMGETIGIVEDWNNGIPKSKHQIAGCWVSGVRKKKKRG